VTTRQHKTPRQRAEEARDLEQRRVERLTAKAETLRRELAFVDADLEDAVRRRDYLAQHPDLNTSTTSTTDINTNTTEEHHA